MGVVRMLRVMMFMPIMVRTRLQTRQKPLCNPIVHPEHNQNRDRDTQNVHMGCVIHRPLK